MGQMAQCEDWNAFKDANEFSNSFELGKDFDFSDPESLKWFIQNVKIRMFEQGIFEKMELGQMLMNERREFIENQMAEYMLPSQQMMQDKIKQIGKNNHKLRMKMKEINKNQSELEHKLKCLQAKAK